MITCFVDEPEALASRVVVMTRSSLERMVMLMVSVVMLKVSFASSYFASARSFEVANCVRDFSAMFASVPNAGSLSVTNPR